MTERQEKALRRKIWEDMTGCTCTKVISVAGKTVALKAHEMCTRSGVRCNGRLKCIHEQLEKHGLKP